MRVLRIEVRQNLKPEVVLVSVDAVNYDAEIFGYVALHHRFAETQRYLISKSKYYIKHTDV